MVRVLILIGALCLVSDLHARPRSRKWTYELSSSVQYSFIASSADKLADASYTRKYTQGLAGVLRFGLTFPSGFYVGLLYDYWRHGRTFTVSDSETKDWLRFQNIGPEFGWQWAANPRLFWVLSAYGVYPLQMEVHSAERKFIGSYALGFGARFALGLNLNSISCIMFEGGYRYAKLGELSSESVLYTSGGLDLSGVVSAISLGLRF